MKGLVREPQGFRTADLEPDLSPNAYRRQAFRAFDLPSVWINADDALGHTGNPPGETAVTAADIQDPGSA